MPVFTAIGATLFGLAGGAALAAGVATTAVAGAAVAAGAFALGGGFDGDSGGGDARLAGDPSTGKLTSAEAKSAAKKKAFRAGVIHTSPTGLDNQPKTSSAKLK